MCVNNTQLSLTVLFNGSKSKILFFKDKYDNAIISCIKVKGEIIHISDNAVHFCHNISTSDRDSMILAAKRDISSIILQVLQCQFRLLNIKYFIAWNISTRFHGDVI